VEVLTPRTGDAMHQPHWFRPEAFLSPDFDATAFIADLRRYVSADRTDQHCAIMTAPLALHQAKRCQACWRLQARDLDLRPCVQVPLETLSSELENHLATLKLKVGSVQHL
jgi:hypothetical protein